MCRFAGFVGSSQPLSRLLYDSPHALEHQAYAPRRLSQGHVNVDGTGVAWWPEGETEPLRYITERPPWSDPNLPQLSRRLEATTVLAAVRSATPGVPFGPGNVQPFVLDGHAFTHNGWIGGWRAGAGRDLAELLPDELHAELDSFNDSKALFLHTLALRRTGAAPIQALVGAARLGSDLAGKRGEPAALNLCLVTADSVVAVRTSTGTPCNSMFWSSSQPGQYVASEPLDPTASWVEVPEGHAVEIRPGGTRTRPMSDVA